MFRHGKNSVYRLFSAVRLAFGATENVRAAPLEKLIGKSLNVGNLVFSNIQAPNFTGIGPGVINVQGVIGVDPVTGAQRAGLRFIAPLAQSPHDGPHEIVMNVRYALTDLTRRLAKAHQRLSATASGHANVCLFTQASPSPGFVANDHLTVLETCAGAPVSGIAGGPSLAPLSPCFATYFVEHQLQMITANRNGGSGTTSLREFEILYGE